MQDGSILDILQQPTEAGAVATRGRFTSRGASIAIVLMMVVTLITGAFIIPDAMARFGFGQDNQAKVRVSFEQLRAVDAMTVEDKSQIVAEGEAAQQQNAEIPVSGLPLEKVRGFKFSVVDDGTYQTALRCMTQAVYYEAAYEPIEGRRAVAQVVLNRMRHPAYPKSVCGVVYQGSERQTGCQFSFTCDGALLRAPAAAAWHAASEVAKAALAGYVETSVGTATHYHADYVLPKWAFSLAKIEQIGRHIFYRFTGNWGRSLAFNGRYAGFEAIPQINLAALKLKTEDPAIADSALLATGLTVAPEVTDRHAPTDIGGRLDMTKQWRLAIPDPVSASSNYRKAHGEAAPSAVQAAGSEATAPAMHGHSVSPAPGIAAADPAQPAVHPRPPQSGRCAPDCATMTGIRAAN